MKRTIATWLATAGLLASAVTVLRAAEGGVWQPDQQDLASDCSQSGVAACEVWDTEICQSTGIFSENCTDGATRRVNIRSGHCSGGSCQIGF